MRDDGTGSATPVLIPYVCDDGQPDIEVSEDDMPLIAAAPELLEALKALRGDEWRCSVDWGPRLERDTINAKADAAIAKAEGK